MLLLSAVTTLFFTSIASASNPSCWGSKWERIAVAPPSTPFTLSVGLQSAGLEEIKQTLASQATHRQQHLSRGAVLNLLAPSLNTTSAFLQWISAHQVDLSSLTWSRAHDWASWNTTVAAASELLDVTFFTFRHRELHTEVIRAPEYEIPKDLSQHIKMVHPTKLFPGVPTSQDISLMPSSLLPGVNGINERRDIQAVCGAGAATLPCLQELYNINYVVSDFSAPGNSYGVVGFGGDTTNIEDLRQFMSTNLASQPDAAWSAYRTYIVNGGSIPAVPNLKVDGVDIGIQYGAALAYPIPATLHSVGGSGPNGSPPLLEWVQWAKTALTLPSVLVINYAELEENVTEEYAQSVCDGFAALAARGVSVIVPSGDHGSSSCSRSAAAPTSRAIFPASCPYVTAVGGTAFDSSSATEHGVNFSGGGYSSYFSTPPYQTGSTGRAYPDVAALATSYTPVIGGTPRTLSTTAGSATTFAAMIALINDLLIEQGKPALGFLNPWLYGPARSALKDVTVGQSVGCASPVGFNAAAGWDAVTGLGTPNWAELAQAANV